jgi:hypothetical protein
MIVRLYEVCKVCVWHVSSYTTRAANSVLDVENNISMVRIATICANGSERRL